MKETKILYEWNSLVNLEKSTDKKLINKTEYANLLKEIDIELIKFKKDNPNILVTFIFSPINNQFSIYDDEFLDEKGQNICQSFLDLLNYKADHLLKEL